MPRLQWWTGIVTFVVVMVPGVSHGIALAQPDPAANARTEPRTASPITQEELNRLIGGPTLLTLHFKEARPQDVLDEIINQAKQQGVEVGYASFVRPGAGVLDGAPVTVDVAQQPFWVAMQTVLHKLKLHASPYGGPMSRGKGITLARTGEGMNAVGRMRGPSLTVGGTVMYADQVGDSQQSTLRLGENGPAAHQDSLWVNLSAYLDPKTQIASERCRVDVEAAADDRGHSLVRGMPGGLMGWPTGWPLSLRVDLSAPRNLGARITRLKGTLHVEVVAKQEEWEVPDILNAKGVTKHVGDEVFTVQSVAAQGDRYTVSFTVSRPPRFNAEPGGFPSSMALNGRSIHLLDQDGHEFSTAGSGFRGDGQVYTGDLTFVRPFARGGLPAGADVPALGEPAKLVWDIASDVRTLDVRFDFTDLPIPPIG